MCSNRKILISLVPPNGVCSPPTSVSSGDAPPLVFAARLQTVVSMFEAFGKISSSTKKATGSQCLHPSVGEIVFGARIDRLRSAVVQLPSKHM